jgi:hypothetical protein
LETLTLPQLRAKHLELFGTESRTKNKAFLQKKLAWQIQQRAEGGLSTAATARIAELAPALLPGRMEPRKRPTKGKALAAGVVVSPVVTRDPRLPEVGTTLQREHQGVVHEVEILAQGFRFRGRLHSSLSAIAKIITGTNWNGFLFFGLISRNERV